MGLEIEIEYDETPDGTWSAPQEVQSPREPMAARLSPWLRGGGTLIVHLGILITAMAVGAASTAGILAGNSAENGRTIARLHLAPLDSFTVQALPTPPAAQPVDQLLATPWKNTFDQEVSLDVINDGPDPVTVLDATVYAMQFQVTTLTPQSAEPIAPGAVSVLRGRAHIVCGDFPAPDESATIAKLRARSADGQIHGETLMVDRSSGTTEDAVCAQMPTPQVILATTFSSTPNRARGSYVINITAANRAPFPLRMALPESAIEDWTSGGGLQLTTPDDVIIQPHGTGTIAITAKVVDCSNAMAAALGGFGYDTLAFSDGRDAPGYAQTRYIPQTIQPTTNRPLITSYCLAKSVGR
jgi:hypothetical protein